MPTAAPLVLCAGSMVRFSFTEMVDAAARAGFDAITVTGRLRHLAARDEGIDEAGMATLMTARGLSVAAIEGSPDWLTGTPAGDGRTLSLTDGLRLADRLGAPMLLVYHDSRPSTDERRCVDEFGAACDRAARLGVTLGLEFLPWSPIADFAAAARIVRAAGRANGRVVFDTWHASRGAGHREPLPADTGRLVGGVQLADAAAPDDGTLDPVHASMFGRRLPGAGVLDIEATLCELLAAGVSCPIAVEVYDPELDSLTAAELAGILADTARAVLTSAATRVNG